MLALVAVLPKHFAPLAAAIEKERKALGAPGVAVAVLEHGPRRTSPSGERAVSKSQWRY